MSLQRDTDTAVTAGRRGSLKAEPAYQIILELCREKRTGALVLENKETRREIVFRQGQIWGVRVDQLQESIPAQLGLDEDIYTQLLLEIIERGTSFRLALSRLLSNVDLNQKLKEIHQERLVEVLGWEEGEFSWFEGERFTEGAQDPLEIHLAILEMVEAQGTRPAHHMLRTKRHRLIKLTERFEPLKKLILQFWGEDSVIPLLEEEPKTYFDLVTAGLDSDRAARHLRALVALGAVEFEQTNDTRGREELPPYVASLSLKAREEKETTLRIAMARRVEEAKRFLQELPEKPRDVKLLSSIRAILRDSGVFDGYFEIAERELKLLQEARSIQSLCNLYKEMGEVWSEKLYRVDEAIRCLQHAAELDPEDEKLKTKLKTIYLYAGEIDAALEINEQIASRIRSEKKKAQQLLLQAQELLSDGKGVLAAKGLAEEANSLHPDDPKSIEFLVKLEKRDANPASREKAATRLGRLAELSLLPPRRDLEQARHYIQRARALDPTAKPLLEIAEKIARTKGDVQVIANVLSEALAVTTEAKTRAEILQKLAALPLGVVKTKEYLESILFDKSSPEENRAEALSGLRTLLNRVGEQARFAFFLEEEIAKETNAERSVQYTLELANLYARSLEDPVRAIAVLETLLLEEPEQTEVVNALRGLGRQASWSSVARLLAKSALEGRWPDPKDPNRVKRLEEAARLMEERVLDPARASALWRRLGELDPGATQPKEAIQRIEAKVSLLQEVFQAMEREAESASEPAQKTQALKRLATAYYEQGHDAARAIGVLARAWEIIPGDQEVIAKLEALYQEVEDWEGVARVLYHRLGNTTDAKERYDILWRYAKVCEERIGRPDAAASALSEILAEHADDSSALERLERLYYRTQDFSAYLSTRARRAAQSQDSIERGAIYAEMAELCEKQMGDRERAVELWRWSLDSRPNDWYAKLSLSRLLLALGRFEELCELYENWAMQLKEKHPRRVALLRQVAQLAGERLQDIELEKKVLSLLAEEDPEDGESLARLAEISFAKGDVSSWYEAGKKMLQCRIPHENWAEQVKKTGVALAKEYEADEQEKEALSILQDLSRGIAVNDYALLEELARLELQVGTPEGAIWAKERSLRCADKRDSFSLISEIPQLWDRVEKGISGKILALKRVLHENVNDPNVWDALGEAYLVQNEWARVLEITSQRVKRTKDPEERVLLLHKVARIEEESLGDPEAALATLRRAFEEHPEIPETFSALVSALTQRERGKELVFLYRTMAKQQKPEEAVQLLHEASQIEIKLCQNTEESLSLLKEAFTRFPGEEKASQVLIEALEKQDRFEDLVEVYLMMAERSAEKTRVSYLLHAAKLKRQELHDPEGELRILHDAYEEYPEDPRTLPAVASAFSDLNRWEDLLALYEKIIEKTEDETTRQELLEEMARICREEIKDLRRTFLLKRRALSLDTKNDLALEELEELAFEAAAFQELSDLYGDLASSIERVPTKAEFLQKRARLEEEKLENPQQALLYMFEAFEVSPEDENLLDELKRLGEKNQDYSFLFKAYLAKRDVAKEVSGKVWLHYTLLAANTAETLTQDLDQAFSLYLEALQAEPAQEEIRVSLRRIAEEISKSAEDPLAVWYQLADVFGKIAQHGPHPVRVEFLCELAQIQNDVMSDTEVAMNTLELALKLAPENESTALQFEEYARNASALPRAWSAFLRESELSDERETAHKLLLRVARLQEETGDILGSVDILRRIMSLVPEDTDSIAKIESLLASIERYEDLIAHHEALAAPMRPGPARRERLLAVAKLWEEKLSKPPEALRIYYRIFQADPQDYEVYQSLIRLYEEQGEWRKLADLLEKRAMTKPDEAAELYLRAGEIFIEHLRLHRNAILAFEAALKSDPQDKNALQSLSQLYEKQQRWKDVDTMLTELSRLTPGAEAVPFLIRRAEILSSRLQDNQKARHVLEEALSRGPKGDAEREVKTRLAHIAG